MVGRAFEAASRRGAEPAGDSPLSTLDDDAALTRAEFADLLASIDRGLRSLPATAQVAKQQGEYLANLVGDGVVTGAAPVADNAAALGTALAPFAYAHKGSFAYVGGDRAVLDAPIIGPILGRGAGVMWKGFETYSQISLRNIVLVSIDWVRTKVFGRDISRF